jgi:hypothetical protein
MGSPVSPGLPPPTMVAKIDHLSEEDRARLGLWVGMGARRLWSCVPHVVIRVQRRRSIDGRRSRKAKTQREHDRTTLRGRDLVGRFGRLFPFWPIGFGSNYAKKP